MQGDYHRYYAEALVGEETQKAKALEAYSKAHELGVKGGRAGGRCGARSCSGQRGSAVVRPLACGSQEGVLLHGSIHLIGGNQWGMDGGWRYPISTAETPGGFSG